MSQAPHDLASFLIQETNRLAEEYQRLAPRVSEDPGTAGDQGEENWAALLRKWLPANFHVVTKGRLLASDGSMSGQIDIAVLTPSYPPGLLVSKHYLSTGVLAAFECKRTLKKEHIQKAYKQARAVKRTHKLNQIANAYNILCAPTLFGVLAHSHEFGAEDSAKKLTAAVYSAANEVDADPYDMPDFFCVANLGSWSVRKIFAPDLPAWDKKTEHPPWGAVLVGYEGPHLSNEQSAHFTPVGAFLQQLYSKLAWREQQLQELARYFDGVGIRGTGSNSFRQVPKSRFPDWVYKGIRLGTGPYDPWGIIY